MLVERLIIDTVARREIFVFDNFMCIEYTYLTRRLVLFIPSWFMLPPLEYDAQVHVCNNNIPFLMHLRVKVGFPLVQYRTTKENKNLSITSEHRKS